MSNEPKTSVRLDQLLLNLGLVASRSRARDAIQRGTVTVNDKVVTKASSTFPEDVTIAIDDPVQPYVSRAALKLKAGLEHFKLSPEGLDCLDIGASTGGFTEVLLHAMVLPTSFPSMSAMVSFIRVLRPIRASPISRG
jgi:23S rRNA (cytidine1920-2'-O)/16S rRNA (cytidine1409-2'-O)-methyltransferase